MQEHFTFTATAEEGRDALAAISRSMAKQIGNPVRRIFACVALYGLPLVFAGVVFPESFDAVYLSFIVFIGVLLVVSRLNKQAALHVAQRFAGAQEVRFSRAGITHKMDQTQSRWSWTSLNRLHLLDSVAVLEFHDWSWIPLPNRLWAHPEAKQQFVEDLRAKVPHLVPDLASTSVPTPFTLINVGAGFAAAELFVLQIFGATRSLLSPGLWRSGIEFAAQNAPQAVAGLLAAASCLAIGGFFVVRHGLRYVNRRRPRLAAGFAAFFIASFAALVIAAFLHQPCGC